MANIPFTSGAGSKKRPILLLWLDGEDVVAAAVTSAKPRSQTDVFLNDIMSYRLTIISRSGRVFEIVNYWPVLFAHGPLQKSRSLDRT